MVSEYSGSLGDHAIFSRMAPIWISHRGFKADAVENTRSAFQLAVGVGFTALETDLRLSSDGHIVLHHDPTLMRLAADGRHVRSLTRRELELVRLGPRKD